MSHCGLTSVAHRTSAAAVTQPPRAGKQQQNRVVAPPHRSLGRHRRPTPTIASVNTEVPAHRCTPDDGDNLTGTSPTLGGGGDTLARRGLRVVFAVGAALAVTLATTTDGKVWAAGDDAVVSEESPRAAAAAS
eukprot:CAMPEP_0198692870 /NCGR_PEP_ID=MMETSP1468-20131203/237453_1 /TAXON_ID=1461545 /ORGANISM="Mantoniella sp, Strain CCMP1436" /LENGTH=132 /DNA_ID=CAMNT_0044447109 /DNA_START=120 /DNA_END=515 /DNA_ORIENTATION=-